MARLSVIFKKILGGCLDFIFDNLGMLIYYDMILGCVLFFWISPDGSVNFFWDLVPEALEGAFLTASILMIIRGLSVIPNSRICKLLGKLITILTVSLTAIEIWVLFMIRSRFSDRLLRLVTDTNPIEANDFINYYVFSLKSLGILLGFILLARVLYVAVDRIWYLIRSFTQRRSSVTRLILKFFIFISFISGILLYFRLDRYEPQFHDTISRTISVIRINSDLADRIKKLENTIELADGNIPIDSLAPQRIIWIIGESDNQVHSELYGYKLPTMPKLRNHLSDGNLIVYSDVVTYSPWTIDMLNILFSPAVGADCDSLRWEIPLLPMILRKAGYAVRLFDNQATLTRGIGADEIGNACIINSPRLSEANFNYRNTELTALDNDLIESEKSILENPSAHTLDIIHLRGLHEPVTERVDNQFRIFSIENYPERNDLNEEEKYHIASYDNTIVAMDNLIDALYQIVKKEDAVIIYISDHGELACEVDNRYARRYLSENDSETLRYFLSIPMYILTTPKFRDKHKELLARLRSSKDRPFSTLYFSQLLLDIAGVDTKYKISRYSVISPDWSSPPRLVWTGKDFDNN